MRTDPRAACANSEERTFWAFVHDAVCHPLMAFSGWSKWSLRFHDWTSFRAWPRTVGFVKETRLMPSRRWGLLQVTQVMPGFYSIDHPNVDHKVVTTVADFVAAAEFAEAWFDGLAAEFGNRFNPSEVSA